MVGKIRVHELAAEFGVPAERLLDLLRETGVFVRSHLSTLEADQVSAARVRWEREKRRAQEEPKPKRGRRKAAAPEPAPVVLEARPSKRRRTAAEVAAAEAEVAAAEAAQQAELEALERDRVQLEQPEPTRLSLEERARALFKDLPPVEAAESQAEEPGAPSAPPAERLRPEEPVRRPPAMPEGRPADSPPGPKAPFIPPRVPRPVRAGLPKPVFSSGSPAAPAAPTTPGTGRPDGGRGRGPEWGQQASPSTAGDAARGGRRGKKGRRERVDQEQVQANISRTLQGMKGSRKSTRRSDEPSYRDIVAGQRAEEREREKTRIRVNEFISVAELAELMKISATQIVQFAFKELGLMVTMNQRLDFDQIELIASEFGFEAVREEEYAAEHEVQEEAEHAEDLAPRPPVVTIMGHVDHGKTSLLDFIRKANIVAGEAGGITQHIGAYHVELPGGKAITFLDTPGHEAFTAMRARGAQVTDIVVLVVAADDQVMPQTVEAISHARNAGVPLVVAINKVDLPSANVQKSKQDLLQHNVVLEEFGGTTLATPISAKTGQNVDTLLEQILLQAELLELKANPSRQAQGTVLEATLDPGKGPVATILVQRGTLRVGDDFICGKFSGRVRAMFDERGKTVAAAGPSVPVQILGFEGVPLAGDAFLVTADAAEAREIAQKRQRLDREAQNRRGVRGTTLEDFSRAVALGEVAALRIIIKADQGGPAEALADALGQLSMSEVRVDVIHRGVGAITEGDVLLAKASGAIVLGFHVRPDSNARAAAEREHVDVRTYRVIYEAVDDVRSALEGMLKPEEKEVVLGEAEVLQLFKVSKVGTIAGCVVRNGTVSRTAQVRVVRDGVPVYTGRLASLKRFKDDVREVKEGLECGLAVENFNDLKVGDRIESFAVEAVKRTLQSAATGAA